MCFVLKKMPVALWQLWRFWDRKDSIKLIALTTLVLNPLSNFWKFVVKHELFFLIKHVDP
jgi:hypothetical protein